MGTDVDQAYQRWSDEDLSASDDSHEITVSQMLDHGSISFGRFPIESLSWERRSVFIHNRCQEELEKFNGLVAKKRAYFEERYRRIRAMKAQQNQQTELTLDYSGEGSISSQSGEEDGIATQHENFRDGKQYIVCSPLKEAQCGATFEQEIGRIEPLHNICSNPESAMPNRTSSRGILSCTEQDVNSIDTLMVQQLETESSLPLTGDAEEIESHCSSNLESLDNKDVLQKQNNLVSDFESRRVTQGTILDTNKINSHELQANEKSLDNKSISKDPAAVRNDKRETMVNVVQPLKGLKITSRKILTQTPSNTLISRIKSNSRSTLVASNRLLREARSNIITPGPFTLVMERRASNRTAANLNSGGSNMLAPARSHSKNSLNVQGTTKKTAATSGMTARGSEITRASKEERSKLLGVNNQHKNSKKTEAHIVGPSKLRSVNLPSRSKLTSNGGTESHLVASRGIKQTEGNVRTREFQRVATKTSAPTASATLRMGAKKPLAARGTDASRVGRKLRLDNLSLDGRNTRRQAAPQWR